jgi:hypothetical protein
MSATAERAPRTRRASARLAAAAAAAPADVVLDDAAEDAALAPLPPPTQLAWWLRFGRHTVYGNGLPRPLLRGWLHFAVLLAGTAALLAGRERLAAWRVLALHATAHEFAAATLVSYVGSVAFHLFPWASLTAYQRALCFDFCTIVCVPRGTPMSRARARSAPRARPRHRA